jgi:hypothetical protein
MSTTTCSTYIRALVVGMLVLISKPAFAQDEVTRVTTACQASLRQMVFWCVTTAQSEDAISTRVEQEANCDSAKQRVDSYCYPVQLPLLGCNSSLQEMEIWCAGKAKFNLTAIVEYCEQAQRNIRLFCYR